MKTIILLNGPSSSGKSTLSKALRERFAQKSKNYAIVSIDDFMKISTSETIYEDDVFDISMEMCRAALSLLQTYDGVIVDHVITSPRIFNQFMEATKDYQSLLVHVACPIEILLKREEERGDRHKGSAQDSYDYLYPKEGYDIEVDTHQISLEECVETIVSF